MRLKDVQVGALIELPAMPPWRNQPIQLYIHEIFNGRVIFGRKPARQKREIRWVSLLTKVLESGVVLVESPKGRV